MLPPLDRSSLVGRERELTLLRERLAEALAGHAGLVLIGGEAGIGKTALAEALSRDAVEQGALVLVGRCYDLTETPPYGPWLDLFGNYHHRDASPSLTVAFSQRGVGRVASQSALFQELRVFLATLAVQQPLVLFLDDLHWSDPASLDLLRFLARDVSDMPLLIIVAYRTEGVTREHPLHTLAPLLVRESSAIRLDLRPLHEEDIRTLLAARYQLRGEDLARLVAYLHERSEGNALFLGELLRTLEEEGIVRAAGDDVTVGDLARAPVPRFLRQVIDARLLRLGGDAGRFLAIGAVIGQEMPFALWAAVAEVNEATLLAATERGAAATLVDETPDGTGARFVHALIREAVYEGIRPSRRRALHRKIAETLLVQRSNPDPDTVASHLQRAGDDRAKEWLVKAGERAVRAHAWTTAADRFEAALGLLDQSEADAGERGWLLYHLGSYRRWTDPASCIAHLTAAELCATIADDRALAASALFARGLVLCVNEDFKQGLRDMEIGVEARRTLTVPERAHLGARSLAEDTGDMTDGQGTLVQWLATAGRFREARFIGERALAEAGTAGPLGAPHDPSLIDLSYGLAQVYAGLGLVDRALRTYRETRQVYRAWGNIPMIGVTAQNEFRWTISYRADRPAELHRILAEAEEAWARATESVSDYQRRYPNTLRLLLGGQWAEFRRRLLTGVNPGHQSLVRQWLGPIARAQGDTELAWDFVRAALPEGPATEPGSVGFLTAAALLRVAAGLALDMGELDDAKAWLEAHDRWGRWSESPLGRADGGLLWATYHRASGDRAGASRQANRALKDASDPHQPLALLGAHRLLGELETEGGHFPEAAVHLDRALTLADACTAPYERALTLLAMAGLHVAADRDTEACALIDEVRAICAPLGAKPALARADALAARLGAGSPAAPGASDGLTIRELEVLRLLAGGGTIKRIAADLFLSARTVERHITTIYRKIGARNRVDAAAYALHRGLVTAPPRDP